MRETESKYKLIVNHVIDGINDGQYHKWDWIPSVNEFRNKYNLSRATVFSGLNELRSRGIIDSTPGVGCYIASTRISSPYNIFLLFNELNEFKEDLYNSFIEAIGKSAMVDLYFHNYNRRVFETLINEANYKYTTYIIMPGKFAGIEPLLDSISGQVLLLDHYHSELKAKFSSVAQNFEKDTYEALLYGKDHLEKYKRIIMVQKDEKEPQERYDGMSAFCRDNNFDDRFIETASDYDIQVGDLFMVVNDRDLVSLIKQAESRKLVLGRDFGIISYNETPLKEVLSGGITTLSTDFKQMGQTMASLVGRKTTTTIGNPWKLHLRSSI